MNQENKDELIENKTENKSENKSENSENKSKNKLSSTITNEEDISLTPEILKYDKNENNLSNFFSQNIINELNSNNKEITIDGKDYESKVRSFLS